MDAIGVEGHSILQSTSDQISARAQAFRSAAGLTNNQECGGDCVAVPPSSNGCGNDFTGAFHSWAMQLLLRKSHSFNSEEEKT